LTARTKSRLSITQSSVGLPLPSKMLSMLPAPARV
jgi:hypothetical protein